jgi:hypothetical protein
VTNIDKIKNYLEQHSHATTREIASALGWTLGTASSVCSHARSYFHIEIAGKQRSVICPRHFETIWRLRRPAVVRSAA